MQFRLVWNTALVTLFCLPTAEAGDRDLSDWGNVAQITSGKRLEIIDMSLKRVRGELIDTSPNELRVSTSSGPSVIPRSQVFRVSLLERSKRTRNVLIGMAIGAGAGLAIGAVVDSSFSEDDEHVAKMLLVPIGIGAGAGFGAALPRFETIYRAPKRIAPPPANARELRP